MLKIHHLKLSWSVSKGRNSYGYNICRLDDSLTGERFKTCGGGYDMIGTVFGYWLTATFQDELLKLSGDSHYIVNRNGVTTSSKTFSYYGMYFDTEKNKVTLDGGCGLDAMIKIAIAAGLEVQRDYMKKGKKRGETLGWYVEKSDNDVGKYIYIHD